MTNEEAIQIMEAYRDKLQNACSNQLCEDIQAFNMAIEYLKKDTLSQELNKLNEENVRLKNENFNLRGVISNVKMVLKMRGIIIEGLGEGVKQ